MDQQWDAAKNFANPDHKGIALLDRCSASQLESRATEGESIAVQKPRIKTGALVNRGTVKQGIEIVLPLWVSP
jgi:hypothetical protein